ncbi:MAG: methyl-accepting chemotaxis protein [Bacillota bacterium]
MKLPYLLVFFICLIVASVYGGSYFEKTSTMYFLLTALAPIALVVALFVILNRTTFSDLRIMQDVFDMLRNNDLSFQMGSTKGEFGTLFKAINETTDQWRAMLEENLDASEQLAMAAQDMFKLTESVQIATQEISSTVEQIARGTEEQSLNIEQTSEAAQQMASIAQQVAIEAQRASGLSTQASHLAKNGMELAQSAKDRILRVRDTVGQSAEVVRRLGQRSQEIGKIVDVIRGISRQTNLLALNAAIEAARAGEHGRGFSVVADEVRSLAEQSTNSAAQIVNMIKEIQIETQAAVEAMKVGRQAVEEGAELVSNASDAFTEIMQGVIQTVNTVQEIAAAAEEQAASSEEMTGTMESISGISKKTAAGSRQVAAAVQEQRSTTESLAISAASLLEMADRLTARVGRFKVNPSFERCWRIMNCNFTSCPAYQAEEEKCWYIPNTLCGVGCAHDGLPLGTITEKRAICHTCPVFKYNTSRGETGEEDTAASGEETA